MQAQYPEGRLVSRSNFQEVYARLSDAPKLSCDTETLGLRPYHGDRLFSIILADAEQAYYFNFQAYEGLDPDFVLPPSALHQLAILFANPTRYWYFFNAKYDLAMLANEEIEVEGEIHCAKACALVEYNEHHTYTLEACLERIGENKDGRVDVYIAEHALTEKRQGATQRYTHSFFNRVAPAVIVPYGLRDALATYRLGAHQEIALEALAQETAHAPKVPTVLNIARNERRLTRTVFRMEQVGVRIDRPYCERAAAFETDRAEKAVQAFKRDTGRDFMASSKLFSDVFSSERDRWGYTDKGNPSFDSEHLARFTNPAARAILEYRDAVSKGNFYRGFLYHADSDDVVHPNFNPDGAGHGRFSSSNPNFQNLKNDEDEDLNQEFVVRRAIIPRPGFVLFMPDYSAMEYRMMFDLASKIAGRMSGIIKLMLEKDLDPHQATADVVTEMGTPLKRGRAKNGNFAFLYGSGIPTLAAIIGSTIEEARVLKRQLKQASPEVADYIELVINTARTRGWVFNWAGRRCYFPDPQYAYCAPNYVISGGCADVNKIALNRIDEYLLSKKSRLIMTVHDENPVEVHESEVDEVPRRVKELMEGVFPYTYLPLTVGSEWSEKSLADKRKGFPV